MKNLIKSILFLLIFGILFNLVFKVLWLQRNPISYFYDEPKNSLDVVYVGSSNAYAHFNTTLAYNEYGFTTGLLSTDSQPFTTVKYLIKESEKYQNPSLYIIDLAKLADDFNLVEEGHIRKTLDSIKFSKNKIEAVDTALKYSHITDDYIPYYFSFLKYHNSWKNLTYRNFVRNEILYKGYLLSTDTIKIVPQDNYEWSNNISSLNEKNKEVLIDLINYIKQNQLNVIFVIPRRIYTDNIVNNLNDAISIINESDLKVINFNNLSDFDVDFEHDLYNSAHLNVYGATKYTLYFSKYLHENYDLKDHRGDKLYSSWDEEYNRFKNSFKSVVGVQFEELLDKYKRID